MSCLMNAELSRLLNQPLGGRIIPIHGMNLGPSCGTPLPCPRPPALADAAKGLVSAGGSHGGDTTAAIDRTPVLSRRPPRGDEDCRGHHSRAGVGYSWPA